MLVVAERSSSGSLRGSSYRRDTFGHWHPLAQVVGLGLGYGNTARLLLYRKPSLDRDGSSSLVSIPMAGHPASSPERHRCSVAIVAGVDDHRTTAIVGMIDRITAAIGSDGR